MLSALSILSHIIITTTQGVRCHVCAIAISHHPHLVLCTFLCGWYEKYESYISHSPMKLGFWLPESSAWERQWPKVWKVVTIHLLLLVLATKVR